MHSVKGYGEKVPEGRNGRRNIDLQYSRLANGGLLRPWINPTGTIRRVNPEGALCTLEAQWLKSSVFLRPFADVVRGERSGPVRLLSFTMGSAIHKVRVTRGIRVMCTSQGLMPRAHTGPQHLVNHAHDGFRCDARTRCPRATVGAPDDDLRSVRPNHTTSA